MSLSPASCRRQSTGFTLIELMVTISVIAIMLALAMPSMNTTISNSRDRGVVQKFSQDYDWLRSKAGSSTVTLTINADCSWQASVNNVADAAHSMAAADLAAIKSTVTCAGSGATPLALPATLSFNAQGFETGPTGGLTFRAANGQAWPLQILYSGSIVRVQGAS